MFIFVSTTGKAINAQNVMSSGGEKKAADPAPFCFGPVGGYTGTRPSGFAAVRLSFG